MLLLCLNKKVKQITNFCDSSDSSCNACSHINSSNRYSSSTLLHIIILFITSVTTSAATAISTAATVESTVGISLSSASLPPRRSTERGIYCVPHKKHRLQYLSLKFSTLSFQSSGRGLYSHNQYHNLHRGRQQRNAICCSPFSSCCPSSLLSSSSCWAHLLASSSSTRSKCRDELQWSVLIASYVCNSGFLGGLGRGELEESKKRSGEPSSRRGEVYMRLRRDTRKPKTNHRLFRTLKVTGSGRVLRQQVGIQSRMVRKSSRRLGRKRKLVSFGSGRMLKKYLSLVHRPEFRT
eukprot:GHVQ01004778.1.p1 GENE.GHVQ01004778.1~~GHVQ01004778.1.p1  ORF type:complete len:294 (+),score=47.94 GHVQ01004778.1:183-1064(+)